MTEWRPDKLSRRLPHLEARARLQAALRQWFASESFVEVETPILQVAPGAEVHLTGFATEWELPDGEERERWLHSSPEFAMKKLLAAGETRIAAFAHVWRNRERGPRHSPEFTMLEWYRVGEGYEVLMADTMAFLALAGPLRYREAVCDPALEPERISVAEAFRRYAGIDLLATLDGAASDRDALAVQAEAAGVKVAADDVWSDIFSRVLSEKVEPHLGHGRVTILDRYPVAEAALARPAADDPRVAERFELYACGVELANGFGELTNPTEQRRRFQIEMDEKSRVYGERYPLDEDFLAALSQMPAASGIALGFDRLVMLATGAPRIDDVIWAPVPI